MPQADANGNDRREVHVDFVTFSCCVDSRRYYARTRNVRTVRMMPLAVRAGLLAVAIVASFALITGVALRIFAVPVPVGDVVVGAFFVALVAALPIAVAGLGTGQLAFVELFGAWAAAETLLACHLTLSLLLIALRGGAGLLFAGEFSREALAAARVETP